MTIGRAQDQRNANRKHDDSYHCRGGLLWFQGKSLGVEHADKVAKDNGFSCAEKLCRILHKQRFRLDEQGKIQTESIEVLPEPPRKPRKPSQKPRQRVGKDAAAISTVLNAIVNAMGHGGLSYVAERLGMSPSAAKKRLERPGAGLDEPTMRALILVQSSKADAEEWRPIPIETKEVGKLVIEIREKDGERMATWRVKE